MRPSSQSTSARVVPPRGLPDLVCGGAATRRSGPRAASSRRSRGSGGGRDQRDRPLGGRARRSRDRGRHLGVGLVVRRVGAVHGSSMPSSPASTAAGSTSGTTGSSNAPARRGPAAGAVVLVVDRQHQVDVVELRRSNRRATCRTSPSRRARCAGERRRCRVHPVAELGRRAGGVHDDPVPEPRSSSASRSRNSAIGDLQMFPQQTTVIRRAGRSCSPLIPGRTIR